MKKTIDLDTMVAFRRAFAERRAGLLKDWLVAHRYDSQGVTHWAQRLRETNDAEMAFAALVEVR